DSLLSGRSLLAAGAIYSDWAEIERVDITQPIAIEIPDSLWIQLGLMETPMLPEADAANAGQADVSPTAATDSVSRQVVAPSGDREAPADSTIAVTDSLQRGFEAADIPSGPVANAKPDSLEQPETVTPVTTISPETQRQPETVTPVTTISPGTQRQPEIESRPTIHLLDLYTLISTRYPGSDYARRAAGLTAALNERMKPAVDSTLVSVADTTDVPLDREGDIAVDQKDTDPTISERRREDADEAGGVPGAQRPEEALQRDLLDRPPTVADTTTYDSVDVEPRLVGGDGALQRMFRYPDTAAEGQVSGRVELRFVVDERGRILEPSITESVGAGCDEEALRVIRLSRFRPATIDGRAVRYRMALDVNCAPDPRR
ncbi:MAG: energy transducer TonB, partial [Rhodothermales bacterium]|nr:energy transducer TonB [Rhodothermales bacterium]